MKEAIVQALTDACKDLFAVDVPVVLTRPDEQFGDYATNVALQLAKKLANPPTGGPRDIARQLAEKLQTVVGIKEVKIAGPGFLNFTLTDEALWQLASLNPTPSLKGKSIVVEYSDPNPFKILHVGHLYDSVVGESIANLCEAAGGTVHRVNFGGDVGLHVGKTMWAILKKLDGELPDKLQAVDKANRPKWLTKAYVEGSRAYDEDTAAKPEIVKLNKRIYLIHEENDKDSALAQIYWAARQWSYDYFDAFYDRIGTKFEKYYPESQTAPIGLKVVLEQLQKGVFKKSDGAVIFEGEVQSLHTRVFVNSEGLPTYETKDIGLALKKWQDYKFDQTIILTGNEIVEYMKVVLAALAKFEPTIAARTKHLAHGMVKLSGGTKMSSRKGNILGAEEVLDMTAEAIQTREGSSESLIQAAVKYSFLKQRIGGDIIYDPTESVALEGNSGPYLQYAHARARSILSKVDITQTTKSELEAGERNLARKIGEYAEVVDKAVGELMPHHICTYLYELAQVFNRFYEKNRVIGDEREALRTQLVQAYADTLKNGLELLNIPAPEKM